MRGGIRLGSLASLVSWSSGSRVRAALSRRRGRICEGDVQVGSMADHRRGTDLAGSDDRGVRNVHKQNGRARVSAILAWSQFGRRLRPKGGCSESHVIL